MGHLKQTGAGLGIEPIVSRAFHRHLPNRFITRCGEVHVPTNNDSNMAVWTRFSFLSFLKLPFLTKMVHILKMYQRQQTQNYTYPVSATKVVPNNEKNRQPRKLFAPNCGPQPSIMLPTVDPRSGI